MIVILSTCLVVFMVSLILSGVFNKSMYEKFVVVFSFFIIFLLYLLKNNEILPDLGAYFSLFKDSQLVSFDEIDKLQKFRWFYKFEFFWCLFTKILSSITPKKEIIVIVSAVMVLIGYLAFIKKFSKMITFSIMLFLVMFFYNSCFVLRQNIAVAICLFSVSFIIKRKMYFFLMLVFFAGLFHNSALFFILLYWLYPLKITKKYLLLFFSVSVALSFISYTLITYLSWFSSYSVYVDKISHGSWYDAANETPLFISIAILVFALYHVNLNKLDGIDLFCLHALLFVCALNLCRLGMPGVVGRMTLYFSAPLCVFIPNLCKNIENKYQKFGYCCLFFSFYSLMCFRSLNYGFEINLF